MSEDLEYDETLRLLARVEVPEGLAERVKARLKQGEVIQWPEKQSTATSQAATWMKRAAAAAIVFVVSGGSWFVYTGVNSAAAGAGAKPVVIESQKPGEFGNAGAMRKVDPLTAPVAPPSNKDAKKQGNKKAVSIK